VLNAPAICCCGCRFLLFLPCRRRRRWSQALAAGDGDGRAAPAPGTSGASAAGNAPNPCFSPHLQRRSRRVPHLKELRPPPLGSSWEIQAGATRRRFPARGAAGGDGISPGSPGRGKRPRGDRRLRLAPRLRAFRPSPRRPLAARSRSRRRFPRTPRASRPLKQLHVPSGCGFFRSAPHPRTAAGPWRRDHAARSAAVLSPRFSPFRARRCAGGRQLGSRSPTATIPREDGAFWGGTRPVSAPARPGKLQEKTKATSGPRGTSGGRAELRRRPTRSALCRDHGAGQPRGAISATPKRTPSPPPTPAAGAAPKAEIRAPTCGHGGRGAATASRAASAALRGGGSGDQSAALVSGARGGALTRRAARQFSRAAADLMGSGGEMA